MKKIIKKIYFTICIIITFLYQKIFGIKKKYAVFESFNGKQYSDNPRAISEKLHELDSSYEIVWLLSNTEDKYGIIPDYVKIVSKKGLNWLIEIAKCSVFVTNTELYPKYYKNNKKQFFIQTWHGDRGFKKCLYEVSNSKKILNSLADNKLVNVSMAGSSNGVEFYRNAFHYYGKVLNVGCPRNDKLINRDLKNEKNVRKKLNLDNCCVLLYAPTFRDNNIYNQTIDININKILKILEERYNKKWVCLVRSHPATKKLIGENDNQKVIDVSNYPDMADLLAISDMLITDYSSSSGDFSLCNKPIILCQFDRESYMKNCREFKHDAKDLGYIIATSQEELEKIITTYDKKDYEDNCELVKKKSGVTETGESSLKICNIIIDWQNSIK